jgi:putative cardiolipin synthase
VTPEALDALRKSAAPKLEKARAHRFATELRNDDSVQRLVAGDWPMQWTAKYRFVADDPAKALGKESGLAGSQVLEALAPAFREATGQVTIISPYFVPGTEGAKGLVAVVKKGTAVRVLTNSLAANDVAMVYGATRRRGPICSQGA